MFEKLLVYSNVITKVDTSIYERMAYATYSYIQDPSEKKMSMLHAHAARWLLVVRLKMWLKKSSLAILKTISASGIN